MVSKSKIKLNAYEIIWQDSAADRRAWVDKEYASEVGKVAECKSIGYLVEQDKERVIIAMSENHFEYGRIFTIPKGCIVKMTRVYTN